MNQISFFCTLCSLSFLGLSCHKEIDTNSPVITIVKPVKGSVYSVNDTIWISATITDESLLESVKVSLLDQDQKPVLGSKIFYPGASDYNLITCLPIDDIHLSGGLYSIQVKAFDGTNFTNAFIEVQINEIPMELKSVVLVSRSGIYGTDISTFSGSGDWHKVLSLSGDYKTSDVSSYDQLVYTAGALSGNLNATFLPAGTVDWQLPLVSSPPYRYFEDIFFFWPLLYVAYYDGSIYGYNRQGTIVFSANVVNDYFPERLCLVNNVLLASLQSKTGKINLLAAYYQVSGSIIQSLTCPINVIAFKAEDNDNVLVFGNDGNLGKIMEYTLSQNKLRLLHEFPDGPIHAVARNDEGNYFIAGGQGVHWYIRSSNTLVEFLPSAPGALIDVDIVNEHLYVISKNYLSAYELSGGKQILNIPVADSALALHLLYNK